MRTYKYRNSIFLWKPLAICLVAIFSITGCAGQDGPTEVATFAGGCFWCTEAMFERVKGVKKVVSGYAGGEKENPTYEEVSMGRTNHAEAFQVYYNTAEISYQQLLEMFFYGHDPTQLNKQEPDIGTQYRSAVFYHNDNQKQLAYEYLEELQKSGDRGYPIVTELKPLEKFFEAEEYHQDFVEKNPNQSYVVSVAKPKIEKFEKKFSKQLKSAYQ
ncbi:MAG: peptide-methionine (S)-S-oxide reductase MsrA [Cyclobacteriaceae bacterium]